MTELKNTFLKHLTEQKEKGKIENIKTNRTTIHPRRKVLCLSNKIQ